MHAWLVSSLFVELCILVIGATALQRSIDDGKALLTIILSVANICIIMGELLYFLTYIYPIIHGR